MTVVAGHKQQLSDFSNWNAGNEKMHYFPLHQILLLHELLKQDTQIAYFHLML